MSVTPRVSAFAGILLAASTVGCHSWRLQDATPAEVLLGQRPATVQVHQLDGAKFVLAQPHLAGDTIRGVRAGVTAEVPLAGVNHLAVRRFNTGKTALLVLGIPAGIFGVALIGCATSNCGY